MVWQLGQRKNKGGGANAELAAEMLRAFFQSSGMNAGGRREANSGVRSRGKQWFCKSCNGLPNDENRAKCRGCGILWKSQEEIGTQRETKRSQDTKPLALAPWATPEMRQERVRNLEEALAAAQASGGCASAAASLESALKAQQKTAEKVPGNDLNLRGIESTRGFLIREERRRQQIVDKITELEQNVADLWQQEAKMTSNIEENRKHL